jgi:hypothetical protein
MQDLKLLSTQELVIIRDEIIAELHAREIPAEITTPATPQPAPIIKERPQGTVLVNIQSWIDGTYNTGAWAKTVVGLDKTKTNGYSLLGSFIKGSVNLAVGSLVLVKTVGGSRKNQVEHYRVYKVLPDGDMEKIEESEGSNGYARKSRSSTTWATDLWDCIEHHFATNQPAILI